ncbi:sigma factor-like helix-turn-helix DNA-binding protein [Heliophilum fasciatum]|uniref:RNA polymerase sigma factor (Sigma-70 family) n=1 Tax=Heliophilum fasciatum TaxID=35700 RepID=A0A4R2RMN3_9FIRM|nr:sigma factor-like helix-turn-helix DNA-binding protein [Heliophilum fasciatum]MCW2279294.1 DNA-directed RNA polymerase specialized sigma24 family protein [Heliophilum fasciatum]TCP60455.1 RNA polymerase sigma factor (sigma-70 family) [Heliophilum fasciatum]
MGTCKIDFSAKQKRFDETYPIDKERGIYALLLNVHKLREMRFRRGDYAASDLLTDFTHSILEADLTVRQQLVIYLVYFRGFTQQEVARQLSITQQGVSDHINAAVARIATVNRKKEQGVNVA